MKKSTIEVLKNFCGINTGIVIRAGSKIKVKSPASDAFAEAHVEDNFPHDMAIYDVPELLAVISLFKEPTIEYTDKHIRISEGSSEIFYMYSEERLIVAPDYSKNFSAQGQHITCTLMNDDVKNISNACTAMRLKYLSFSKQGIRAYNNDNSNTHKYLFKPSNFISTIENNEKYDIHSERLKFLPGDYDVVITDLAAVFTRRGENKLFYIIPYRVEGDD